MGRRIARIPQERLNQQGPSEAWSTGHGDECQLRVPDRDSGALHLDRTRLPATFAECLAALEEETASSTTSKPPSRTGVRAGVGHGTSGRSRRLSSSRGPGEDADGRQWPRVWHDPPRWPVLLFVPTSMHYTRSLQSGSGLRPAWPRCRGPCRTTDAQRHRRKNRPSPLP